MSADAAAPRPITLGGAAWNLIRAAFWLSFAGLTLWIFWILVDPATPQYVNTSGFSGDLKAFLGLIHLGLSILGALLRRLTSGWSPRYSFQFRGELLVWTDRATGKVTAVETNWGAVVWNFFTNYILGAIVYIYFWAVLEVFMQVVFILRTLAALASGKERPVHSWPHRFSDLGILLSWISLLLFIAVVALGLYLTAHSQSTIHPPVGNPGLPPPPLPPQPPPPLPPDTEPDPSAPLYKLTLSVTLDPSEISESGDVKIHGQSVHWDLNRTDRKAASDVQLAEGQYQYHLTCKGTAITGTPLEGSGDGVLKVTRGRNVVLVRGRVNPDGRTFPAALEYAK